MPGPDDPSFSRDPEPLEGSKLGDLLKSQLVELGNFVGGLKLRKAPDPTLADAAGANAADSKRTLLPRPAPVRRSGYLDLGVEPKNDSNARSAPRSSHGPTADTRCLAVLDSKAAIPGCESWGSASCPLHAIAG